MALKILNADMLENTVRQTLAPGRPKLADEIGREEFSWSGGHRPESHVSKIIGSDSPMEFVRMMPFLESKIVVAQDKIQIHLPHDRLGKLADESVEVSRQSISQDRMLAPEIKRAIFQGTQPVDLLREPSAFRWKCPNCLSVFRKSPK